MLSGIRLLPACCRTRWRRERWAPTTRARSRFVASWLRCGRWINRGRTSAPRSPAPAAATASAGTQLLGRHMPDLDLVTADGPISVFSLLHSAKPVLLNFGQAGGFDSAPWAERVQLVDASYAGIWEPPVVGEVTAPSAVLVRPDGHVAWVGAGAGAGGRVAPLLGVGCRAPRSRASSPRPEG